jgi:hypothetical protein
MTILTVFFDGPINQHAYLNTLQNGSSRNWKTLVLRTIPVSIRTGNRHITHSLLGNTLVWLSGNVSMAVGRQCFSLQFTGHTEAPNLLLCGNSGAS